MPGTNEAVTGGKDDDLYVVNQKNLGGFNLTANKIIQQDTTATGGDQIRATPAYFDGAIYLAGLGGNLVGHKLNGGKIAAAPIGSSAETYDNPEATVSVSADRSKDGIVWAIQRVVPPADDASTGMPNGYAVLNAYNASIMAELYTSATDPTSNAATAAGIKFSVPTIADGHVLVGTASALLACGLTPKVTAGQVVNTATHVIVATIADGSTVNLSGLKGTFALSVTLDTPAVGSVRYTFGSTAVTDDSAPYHLFDSTTTHAGVFAAGTRTVTVGPFDFANAAGFEGVGQTVTFTVT